MNTNLIEKLTKITANVEVMTTCTFVRTNNNFEVELTWNREDNAWIADVCDTTGAVFEPEDLELDDKFKLNEDCGFELPTDEDVIEFINAVTELNYRNA